jgi:hypothetical protein
METEKLFQQLIDYSELGYDVTLTSLFGKEAIKMVKRYSYTAKQPLVCEQIQDHKSLLIDDFRLHQILQFLYDDIQEQEESGEYYKPFEE